MADSYFKADLDSSKQKEVGGDDTILAQAKSFYSVKCRKVVEQEGLAKVLC